eukprot:gene21163-28055_t
MTLRFLDASSPEISPESRPSFAPLSSSIAFASILGSEIAMVVGSVPTCASSRLGGAIAPVVVHGSVNSGGNKHLHRDIRVHASKETYVEEHKDMAVGCNVNPMKRASEDLNQEHKDMAVGYNVNPMKRASEDLNLVEMIGACSRWQQLKQLVDEMDEQFEKAPRLLVETVVKVADLMASSKMVDEMDEQFEKAARLVVETVVKVANLMAASKTVVKVADLMAASKVGGAKLSNDEMSGDAGVIYLLLLMFRVKDFRVESFWYDSFMQNIVSKAKGIRNDFRVESFWPDSFMQNIVSKDFRVESFWSDGFMQNIMSKAKGIRNVRSYPALLYGLSRLNMPMPTTLLEEVAAGLAAAPKGGKGGKAKAPPPLMELEAADVGVVTAVMARAMAEGLTKQGVIR